MVQKRQRLFRFAVDLFIDLLEQITKNKSNYKCNSIDFNSFNVFVDRYGDNMGEEFIRSFVQYQIQSWFNPSITQDVSRIRLSWLFGAPAIKRWNSNNIEVNALIVRGCLKTINKISTIKRSSKLSELLLQLRDSEENHKQLFLNSQKGYAWCIANTTLYFHKSANCVVCKYKNDCKDMLKKQFPKVNKLRGYGE